MKFNNAQVYRLPKNWLVSAERMAEQLSRQTFIACGALDQQSRGFIDQRGEGLVRTIGTELLICLLTERRLLPSEVVHRETMERVEVIEDQQGWKPGRKQMREIKETVIDELMPKAFVTQKRIHAWIDRENGYLVIDASSRSAAEPLIEALHKAMDELPLKLLNTKMSPAFSMTNWLAGGEAPAGFTIDQDCELRALTDGSSTVRYARHTLEGEEIREHIKAGKQVSKLALTYDDRVSFVLTEKFEIKRVSLTDTVTTTDSSADAKTGEEQADADFALFTGEMRRLIPSLLTALGGETSEDDLLTGAAA